MVSNEIEILQKMLQRKEKNNVAGHNHNNHKKKVQKISYVCGWWTSEGKLLSMGKPWLGEDASLNIEDEILLVTKLKLDEGTVIAKGDEYLSVEELRLNEDMSAIAVWMFPRL